MFTQRWMKVIGIGIPTPRIRLVVWNVICRVLELLLASQYWRLVSIIWKVCQTKLQRRDIDVFEAYTMIDDIKWEIQCLRNEIGVEFQRWYEAKQLASYIGTRALDGLESSTHTQPKPTNLKPNPTRTHTKIKLNPYPSQPTRVESQPETYKIPVIKIIYWKTNSTFPL